MKNLLIILFIGLFGCKHEPEFYINGKPYYTNTYCIKSHIIKKNGFHVGATGGIPIDDSQMLRIGEYEEIVCDKYRIDTIEIK